MRWDELKIEEQDARALPGYRDPARVRTFDAPEAMDVRFYEVQAKSVLNRVPKQSRMPFEWTINPYRGCTHACAYCLRGDTPILMGDGRTAALEDLRVGDEIYGTRRQGAYRRYVTTRVLDKWSSIKPAYRVTLDDGTELIASGDHRFLSDRGWKHVTGTDQGALRRPHLTLEDKLMGTGRLAGQPCESADYRRGYLCGVIGGDGHARDEVASVREASCLDRRMGGQARTVEEVTAGVVNLRHLTGWPRDPTAGWCKGFLAGIFDADGHHGETVRIANRDREILGWTSHCLRRLGFATVTEDHHLPNGMCSVRIRGGLPENLRFFLSVDPAMGRKRQLEGKAIKTSARLGVAAIEPLGVMRLYDITTATGDFIANGVVSHNCFARPTHTYLDFDAGRDFEREIVVKVNAPEVARAELSRPRWRRHHVAMGTNTDPYQWVEARYRLMPGIWEAMRDTATPGSILTKSPLLLRDVELMKQVGDRGGISANLSIPTVDEKVWRATEPHTPYPRARIEAVAELNRAGIPCGVLIAPLMPGVNDHPQQVEEILDLCAEAGAVDVGGIALHLRGEVRQLWFDWLAEHRPDLVERYRRLYRNGAYATTEERARLAALARGGGRRTWPRRFGTGGAVPDPAEPAPGPARTAAAQERLF